MIQRMHDDLKFPKTCLGESLPAHVFCLYENIDNALKIPGFTFAIAPIITNVIGYFYYERGTLGG